MSIECTPVSPQDSFVDELVYKYSVHEYIEGYNYYGKTKCFLPVYYSNYIDNIDNFEVKKDDVWVMSYQKSGTTWTREMVWMIGNDLDYERSKEPLGSRIPFLELSCFFNNDKLLEMYPKLKLTIYDTDSVRATAEQPSPRFINSHLPWDLLPKQIRNGDVKPKIVYIARNPKDVCVSYFHHATLTHGFTGNFDVFCELFLNDRLLYSPYWTHINDFWNRRNEPNILYITYEQMKTDLKKVIERVSRFLEKKLSEADKQKLIDHLSFDSMQKNPATNFEWFLKPRRDCGIISNDGGFIRNGKIGSHKTEMSPEYLKKFDCWIEKNLKLHGLPLDCF